MNWEETEGLDDEEYEELLFELQPSDFYFQLDLGSSGYANHYFIINPKGYYDIYKRQMSREITPYVSCIPHGFDEDCETTFTYNGNPQVGRQLLLQAGFIEKKMF